MGDIYRAMQIEQSYIKSRIEGLDTVPLLEMIAGCGYSDLEQYFLEKRGTVLKSYKYNVCTVSMPEIPSAINAAVESSQPSIFWPSCDNAFVWHGNDKINRDLCSELGIDILDMGYSGGTIVSSPEDFSFGVLIPEGSDIDAGYFLELMNGLFLSHGLNSEVNGNDILVDNAKVVGSMSFRINGLFFFGCQISFVDHSEQIDLLCNKRSSKLPGFIDTAKLSKATMEYEVMSWLQEQDQ